MDNIKTKILGFAMAALVLVGCTKEKEEIISKEKVPFNSIKEFFETNEVKAQDFTINTGKEEVIIGNEGTIVTIPKDAFVKSDGTKATGDVKIKLKELFKASDMVLSNKPTNAVYGTGEKTFLISEGETEIRAFKDNEELELSKLKKLTISVPAKGKQDNEMSVFVGDVREIEAGGSTMFWTLAKGRVNFAVQDGVGQGNNSLSRFIYDSFGVGWTNCDKFYNYSRKKTTTKVNLSTSPNTSEVIVFMISKDDNRPSVVRYTTPYDKGLKSYTNSIPVGLEVTFVAISIDNNIQYMATKKHIIAENEEIDLTFEAVTSNEIKEKLSSLN